MLRETVSLIMKAHLIGAAMILLSQSNLLRAQVPLILNHQGRVTVGGAPFQGNGQFGFALVNGDGSQTYWRSAEDLSPADGQPDTLVNVTVSKGLYTIPLGDPALMLALDASMLAHPDVRLRVWFSDGTNGTELLSPDQRLGSAAYAVVAQTANTVAAGAVGSAQLADGAVVAAKIGPEAVGQSAIAPGAIGSTQLASDAGSLLKVSGGILRTTTGSHLQIGPGSLLGLDPADAFTQDGKLMGQNTLGWMNDSWSALGPTLWMSGRSGLKFFTGGSLALSIDPAGAVNTAHDLTAGGKVGIGMTNPGEKLEVAGRVVVGDSAIAVPKPGTMRWNGTDFEGFDGANWVSLTGRTIPSSIQPVSGMVWIQPGAFTMGSPESDLDSTPGERPQTVVTLTKGFWIASRETTQAQYLAVMGSNPSFFTGDLNRPVEQVTWNDAESYCTLLTTQERTAGRIPSNWSYRLPTEAEWEYAARAGSSLRFSFGDDPGYVGLTFFGWYSANSGSTTHIVGGKAPNAWGLYDMHGNVWEWCRDWYATYPGGQVTDPQGPATGSDRVMRGGSWDGDAFCCRSAYRVNYSPGGQSIILGFRAVLAQTQP